MDKITNEAIALFVLMYPNKAIHFSHQFLDGINGNECGFVPNNWDKETVNVIGNWGVHWLDSMHKKFKGTV